MENKYLTSKCNHNERGRCINCLSKKLREEKLQRELGQGKPRAQFADKTPQMVFNKCNHPANAKCINCLPRESLVKGRCEHPPTIKCEHCIQKEQYVEFKEYLRRMEQDCAHKKPCPRCVPPQALYYFINKSCRNHIPYPQAMCNACLPPTVSIRRQTYTHVREVLFTTFDTFRFLDTRNKLAFLYGSEGASKEGGVALTVQAVYFPRQSFNQQNGDFQIFEDEFEDKVTSLTDTMGLKRIGLIFDSVDLTHEHLMLSAHYQDLHRLTENGHAITRFITVRVIRNPQTGQSEGMQCYMVSDQFQTFEKNNLLYKLPNLNEFGLQVAVDKRDNLPTYLRGGIETDRFLFEQAMVWVPSRHEYQRDCYTSYPFFNVSEVNLDEMQDYLDNHKTLEIPQRFLHNFQFLLDVMGKMGIEMAINLCICYSEDEIEEVEKRVVNWIVEEKSSSLLKSHRQKEIAMAKGKQQPQGPRYEPRPRYEDLMQSRLRQQELLQKRYMEEQEEKLLRQLQEQQWNGQFVAEESKYNKHFNDPEFIRQQQQLLKIMEMQDLNKRKKMKQAKQEQMQRQKKYDEASKRKHQPIFTKPSQQDAHLREKQQRLTEQQRKEQQQLDEQRRRQQPPSGPTVSPITVKPKPTTATQQPQQPQQSQQPQQPPVQPGFFASLFPSRQQQPPSQQPPNKPQNR